MQMINRSRALCLPVLLAGSLILPSFAHAVSAVQRSNEKPSPRCSPQALSALRAVPKLEYECAGSDDDNRGAPERDEALKDYALELESTFNDPEWWAAPVKALNVCAVTQEARPATDEEAAELLYRTNIYGDDSTRLVMVADPCIWYSFGTLNAFILQRVGQRVYATQVLDGYFSRIDAPVNMLLANHNGEKLIIIETDTYDGTMPPSPFVTFEAYTISPRTHRAVPKSLFKEASKLTNRFGYDSYVFGSDGPDERMASRWRAPRIIRNGRLAPRFTVYTLYKRRLLGSTYVWNGRYFALMR